MNHILESLQRRYATKKFDTTKKLSDRQLHLLTESMRLAPSSFGLQPWKFLVISNDELRTKLRSHSWGQAQITNASHLIVLCAADDTTKQDVQRYIDSIAKTKNIDVSQLDGYKNSMNMALESQTKDDRRHRAERQVSIALGMLLMTAAEMKIDACPMEGFDRQAYDELLGLTESGYHATVVAAVGLRSEDDQHANDIKVRYDADQVLQYYI